MARDGQTQSELSSIKDDLTTLRHDLEAMIEQALSSGRERGSALKEKVIEAGKKVAGPAQETIRERPLVSLLVIFLVGLVLGKLIDFKRHG